jgi:two-component SAPR family response regulator
VSGINDLEAGTMRYGVIVVEDEKKILAYMKRKLGEFPEFEVRGCFDEPEDALEAFVRLQPDVAFLDVEMPRMTGLQLAEKLLRLKPDTRLVFLTAYEQYALEAFRVEAIDYLLKPVMSADIERVLHRLGKFPIPPKPVSRFPVRVFGTFEVEDRQGGVVKWPTKKAEELFAYLWVNKGRQLGKWSLIELLWPDLSEARGAHTLHTTVYRVKQALQQLPIPAVIERGNATYRLVAPAGTSDWEELHGLTGEPRLDVPSVERAVRLYTNYRQPLFGGRGYEWSVALDAVSDRLMEKMGGMLLDYYRMKTDEAGIRRILDARESRVPAYAEGSSFSCD